MNEVSSLQEHLLLIRRCVGWTAKEFGERIGVTRQTINNLELRRNNLTKTQYLAIRYVLNEEIQKSLDDDDTEMLRCILEIFVDHPERYTKEQQEQCLAKANLMAPAILAGTSSRKTVSTEWKRAVGIVGIVATMAAIPISFISPTAGAATGVVGQQIIREVGKSGTSQKKKT